MNNTIIGQCHKYKEYDIDPIFTNKVVLSNWFVIPFCSDFPEIIKSTVPKHGIKALCPGNIESPFNKKAGINIYVDKTVRIGHQKLFII